MAIINFPQPDTWTFFENSKCRVAVPKHDSLLLDAIEQAILDPSVRSVRHRVVTDELLQRLSPNGIVLSRAEGKFLLVVFEQLQRRTDTEAARLADLLRSNGLSLLERDAVNIQTEPFYSNTREIWSRECYHVPLADRLRFAAALGEHGPLSIVDLEARARPSCDTLSAVSALACASLVRLDLRDTRIGPHTLVAEQRREH
jgi:hypothetical protein